MRQKADKREGESTWPRVPTDTTASLLIPLIDRLFLPAPPPSNDAGGLIASTTSTHRPQTHINIHSHSINSSTYVYSYSAYKAKKPVRATRKATHTRPVCQLVFFPFFILLFLPIRLFFLPLFSFHFFFLNFARSPSSSSSSSSAFISGQIGGGIERAKRRQERASRRQGRA